MFLSEGAAIVPSSLFDRVEWGSEDHILICQLASSARRSECLPTRSARGSYRLITNEEVQILGSSFCAKMATRSSTSGEE